MRPILAAAAGGLLAGGTIAYLLSRAFGSSGSAGRKRYMFRTRVKKDKLEEYKRHHQAVWPDVERGLRKYGVVILAIYAPSDGSNHLNMYVETEPGMDMGRDLGPGSPYRSVARVREWEELMCTMFEGGGWEPMDECYTLFSKGSTNTMDPLYP
mmetsp:Transcript_7364/g.18386  ORF Transcript_7364/g.18386 Transcript_7364/m.18386 type:complete len:154 (-) Transcript_7364:586-1047(-)